VCVPRIHAWLVHARQDRPPGGPHEHPAQASGPNYTAALGVILADAGIRDCALQASGRPA
jgi:hypothetical protein